MISSDLYNPQAAARESAFYNTSIGSPDLNYRRSPHGFFPGNFRDLPPGFFVVMDSSMDARRAAEVRAGR